MTIAVELPEEIAGQLARKWGDLPARAREAIVVEGYRSGALSQAQVQRFLGHGSEWETDEFLKKAGVYLEYSEEDLARDIQASRKQREFSGTS